MSALKVFLTTWNTGLQGSKAQAQDLTSWLLPVLQNSDGPDMPEGEIPDIYAIGIQELLPLHLARKLLTHNNNSKLISSGRSDVYGALRPHRAYRILTLIPCQIRLSRQGAGAIFPHLTRITLRSGTLVVWKGVYHEKQGRKDIRSEAWIMVRWYGEQGGCWPEITS